MPLDYAVLINEVKKRPELYDKGSEFYRNRQLWEKAWTDIGIAVGADGAIVKKEWTFLRNKFQKWKTKPHFYPKTHTRVPGLAEQYADELDFLTEHLSSCQIPFGDMGVITTLNEDHDNIDDSDSGCGQYVKDESWLWPSESDPSIPEPSSSHADHVPSEETPSRQNRNDQIIIPQSPSPRADQISSDKSLSRQSQNDPFILPESSFVLHAGHTPSQVSLSKRNLPDFNTFTSKRPRVTHKEKHTVQEPEHPEFGWFRSLLPLLDKLPEEQKLLWKTEVQMLLVKYVGASKAGAETNISDCLASMRRIVDADVNKK